MGEAKNTKRNNNRTLHYVSQHPTSLNKKKELVNHVCLNLLISSLTSLGPRLYGNLSRRIVRMNDGE